MNCLLNFVILRPPIYTFIVSLYGKPQFDLSYLYASTKVYSAKYQIADKCKYYLADIKNGDAFFEDVTTQTNKIYKKLVLPFENLQRTIYSEK